MTKEDILAVIDSWENLAVIIKEIGQHPEHFPILMDIAMHGKGKNHWRAIWMADKIHEEYPEVILPYIDEMTNLLKTEIHQGKIRHLLKLISLNEIKEEYHGYLFKYCFEAMTSAKNPPAIRVHAMQILYNLSEYEPDLKPEVLALIEHEMEYHATAGILSRGSKLIKKLRYQLQ